MNSRRPTGIVTAALALLPSFSGAQVTRADYDHSRLADALTRAANRPYVATRLPFQSFTFNEALSAIEMTIDGARWTCVLTDYSCRTPELPPPGEIRRGITGPVRGDISTVAPRPRMSPDGKWMAFDFFVRHLMGQNPPEWSAIPGTSQE